MAGCSDQSGDSDNASPALSTPRSYQDVLLAEDSAQNYILYSDKFCTECHPKFVSRISGALCSVLDYEEESARWSVLCWLSLADPAEPGDPLKATVFTRRFYVNLDNLTVEVADR
jgi:hypothetical protein